MTAPDRPVDGAEIATDWGQQVHDFTFAPSGFSVHGAANNTVGTSFSKMPLAVAYEDPGGFLDGANNQIEIPTDRGGLYSGFVTMNTANGSAGAGFSTRSVLRVNGSDVASAKEDNNGGSNVKFSIDFLVVLAAGDILTIYSQRIGAGTSPDVTVELFNAIRVGYEFGA